MNQIITIAAKQVEGIEDIYHIRTRTVPEGIEISFHLSVYFGYNIPTIVKKARKRINEILEHMTSLHVLEINVAIEKISIKEDLEEKRTAVTLSLLLSSVLLLAEMLQVYK